MTIIVPTANLLIRSASVEPLSVFALGVRVQYEVPRVLPEQFFPAGNYDPRDVTPLGGAVYINLH